ncbi:electron transport complex protein RnfA [Mesocricetibacter intestinalis]|uniref:Ion-translocating oxidoreductase complex subunit A n=1 Tax=Mesocricetibacter intestinalis TaxID=1521930 RepID=A0A4R6VBV0_9PAST|nr:electron transport complex subunit RsxA [Mesocricetibacter intestinalis]TDQ59113.1 electron transport complex protein RnfA [Mesocricetibacter intestinalis]
MTEYILLIISTALINNFVLVKFLGLCPFMGVSKKVETAIGMGLATTFVMTVTSLCVYLIDQYLLKPFDATFLRTLIFILAIAVVVQFTEMVIKKVSPVLYRLLGIFLPLITTNCAVLGVALLNINLAHNLIQSILYGFSAALGFALVLILFSSLRERLAAADTPLPFRGTPIALITAGLMSLAFMGFTGLVRM